LSVVPEVGSNISSLSATVPYSPFEDSDNMADRYGYSFGMSGQVVELTDGIAGYTAPVVVGPFFLTEPRGLIVEYASPLRAATALGINVATGWVVSSAPSATMQPFFPKFDDANGVLASAIERAFSIASRVEFEDGIENGFSMQLISLVKEWGVLAVDKITSKLLQRGVRSDIVAQTLLCFGRIEDVATRSARSRVVRQGLLSSSAKVRDAATVAIGSMLDVGAKADISAAIRRESVPSLKEDMQEVLSYL
jgi:hypothetical protein